MASKNKNHHLELRCEKWYFIAMIKGKRLIKPLSTSLATARKIRDRYLSEISLFGDIQGNNQTSIPIYKNELVFGEVSQQWIKIWGAKIKPTTLKDYKCSLNHYILPLFGNIRWTPESRQKSTEFKLHIRLHSQLDGAAPV
jgi:hypothetical protein